MTQKKSGKRGDKKLLINNYLLTLLISIIGIFIAALISYIMKTENVLKDAPKSESLVLDEVKRLRYWSVVLVIWHTLGHLRSMDRVFGSLQYKFVNASNGDDWEILWSIENPFSNSEESGNLFAGIENKVFRPEQKINHFPGIGVLVLKSYMNEINAHLRYILPSFVLPDDKKKLEKFIDKNPDAKLVEKNIFNRGVQIIGIDDILYDKSEYFYQQFMDKPFLIDGHAFDFGVFVLITSFDPIRVYRFDADILLRFCKEKYHPFDPENYDKYVVQSGCHPPYDMPTFEKVYKQYKFPFKRIFENHIEEKGFNVKELWRKIDDAIVSTVLNSESNVLKKVNKRSYSTHHFFELVRYDFIFDENMQPYLMEVNMSPNLTPAKNRYEENAITYEQMIFNVVKMIGGGSYFEFMSRFNDSDIMIANKKNLAVDINSCLKNECYKNCSDYKCKICLPCLDSQNRYHLREAFREHLYEGNFRRLFPTSEYYNDENFFTSMTKNNQISLAWFNEKCKGDQRWC